MSKDANKQPLPNRVLDHISQSPAALFHDQYGEPYIAYNGDGSRVAKVTSSELKEWLARFCWQEYREPLSGDAAKKIITTLSGEAKFDGDTHELQVRHVINKEGLWYDLGGGRAVHITRNGWQVTDKPPIIFQYLPHQKHQVTPKNGGSIDLLRKYINLEDQDELLLFIVYIITAFIPNFPHPLLILHGPQGAGKTTPMQVIKELVDPSQINGLSAPKDQEAFVQTAIEHSFLFFDNLSSVPGWFSDALARASTGDGFSKRKLYTDNETVIHRIQKTVALNGINQIVSRSDLLDRSILLNLQRIDPKRRKEYSQFWKDFEADRPYILAAIFDILSKATTLFPKVKLTNLPRMADFAHWGYVVSEAAGFGGKQFLQAYSANIKVQHDEAIEANPVAQAIMALVADNPFWEGTASELLLVLNSFAASLQLDKSYGWPHDPTRLSKAITIVQPNLLAKGIHVVKQVRGQARKLVIFESQKFSDASDADVLDNLLAFQDAAPVAKVFGSAEILENVALPFDNDATTLESAIG